MRSTIKPVYFPFFLVFYEVATYLSNDMYLPAMPQMMQDLHLSSQQVQLTLSAWFVGSAALPLMVGVISDRYGRRSTLLWGGVLYLVAGIICALSPSVHALLWGRFLQGAATPTLLVAGYSTIHDMYEQKKAIQILALMSIVTILAPAFGPLLGSAILTVSTWRAIFWVIVVWTVVAIGFLYHVMPETRLLSQRQPISPSLLFRQYANIFSNRKFLLLMCSMGLLMGGFIVWISAGALLVMSSFHYSALGFGLFQALVFVFYILGNRLVKTLMEKMDVTRLISFGLAISCVGGILLAVFAILFPMGLYEFIIALSIYSFGTALCFPALNRTIIETSDEPMGMRVALFTVLLMLFGMLGSLIAGRFFDGSVASLALPIACGSVLAVITHFFARRG